MEDGFTWEPFGSSELRMGRKTPNRNWRFVVSRRLSVHKNTKEACHKTREPHLPNVSNHGVVKKNQKQRRWERGALTKKLQN